MLNHKIQETLQECVQADDAECMATVQQGLYTGSLEKCPRRNTAGDLPGSEAWGPGFEGDADADNMRHSGD
jgi:hypothetical protein